MSAVTVDIPSYILNKVEELGRSEGFSLDQFMASAAAEKLDAMLEDFLESEASKGSREGFERFLTSAPDVPPIHPGDVIK